VQEKKQDIIKALKSI